MVDVNKDNDAAPEEVSKFRRVLPQIIAGMVLNLIGLDFGFTLALPTIVIPSVTNITSNNNELNPDETLYMTDEEASWLSGIIFILQPIGSILSGIVAKPLGTRKIMLLVNIPHAIAYLMLAFASSQKIICYIAFGLLGFGVGLMETPLLTYVGEISEPSLRGMLAAFCGMAATTGIFLIFLLGSILSWRIVAVICAVFPLSALGALLVIPDPPIWLISKHRLQDGLKSLQWLRGWTSPQAVYPEFERLKKHNELSRSCAECQRLSIQCEHPEPSLFDQLKEIKRKRTLKPFLIITIMVVAMQFSGMFVMRPYIVQILNVHGIPLDSNIITIIIGLLGIIANLALLVSVSWLGKRGVYLSSMVGTFLSCFGLSIYGFIFFPPGYTSFEPNSSSVSQHMQEIAGGWSYFALAMFLVMQFCISMGVSSIPYIMMCEIFPFKSRLFYCGIMAAEGQLVAFIAGKTYYALETSLSLPGVICLFGVVDFIGFIFMFFILPETEGRSLEDIELHFSDSKHKLTNIYIPLKTQENNNDNNNNISEKK